MAVLLVDKELDSTGVAVADVLAQLHGIVQDGVTNAWLEMHSRGDFHNLLVTTLHGAVTFIEVDDIAIMIGNDLHLNVTGLLNVTLQKHGAVTKRSLCLGLAPLKGFLESGHVSYDTHTTATATHGSLNHDWEAVLQHEGFRIFELRNRTIRAGYDRDTRSNGFGTGFGLVTHSINDIGCRANENHASLGGSTCKAGILTQETVTRMDGINVAVHSDFNNSVDVEIGTDGSNTGTGYFVGFISLVTVHTDSVLMTVNSNSTKTHFVATTENTDGDFTTVAAHDFFERAHLTGRLEQRFRLGHFRYCFAATAALSC
eukprot:Colp12_sorted_trinity150504_noHs@14987